MYKDWSGRGIGRRCRGLGGLGILVGLGIMLSLLFILGCIFRCGELVGWGLIVRGLYEGGTRWRENEKVKRKER